MPEGHQSPPPERQSKNQMGGTGKKTDDHETGKSGKEQLENLSSNPKEPMGAELDKKFAKGEGNKSSG
ncbi:hypothetical protein ACRE_037490 [Hapsidospora chrysogenum ATCC 11550]|uniref:Uncharacterized protein n=1 Tax=Hapsidospora chrysogenum (strain ATCC 11550 / CBS 779.69 / DSM 880 / IAM 14645 / JCM 23072 / IMI 49137) TaxID=857340 RepID=A0A086T7T5_HAPC1|nr:hypothetical protein ACRE_037490 [Hapsidospora chrysogenum ATCC 11550]